MIAQGRKQLKEMVLDLNPNEGRKDIVGKVAKGSHGGNALAVRSFIEQGKYAEATLLLFVLHKTNIAEWLETKNNLLSMAMTSKLLNTYAFVIEASTSPTLQGKAHLIPGLALLDQNDLPDKFY